MTDLTFAELILRGTVRVDAFSPVVEALAVRDGYVIALGARDCEAVTGPETKTVDIDGVIVPGFVDAHIHPALGGLALAGIDLADLHDLDAYRGRIRERAAELGGEWVQGIGWYGDVFVGGFPTAALLDELIPDRPASITSHDGHSTWVNTLALEAAGITADTPDPAEGRIVRDAQGRPTGLLMEGAMDLVRALIDPPTEAEMREALLAAQQYLHSLGIVAWQDAGIGRLLGNPDNFQSYRALDAEGALLSRVTGALWWDITDDDSQVPMLLERRREASAGNRFVTTAAKIMQDGVCENLTAAVLEPYQGHDHETGLSLVPPDDLIRYVGVLGAEGFDLHIHAVGDRAVREALDAIEKLPSNDDARHQIAHIDLIDDADVERMRELGVMANVSPTWAREDKVLVETKLPYLSEKQAQSHFAFGTLHSGGVSLAFGSDWPVSSADPLWAIHVAVNRTAPRDDPHAQDEHAQTVPLLAEQAITTQDAFDAATRGAAHAARLDEHGTLHVGKAADFVVLDADPLGVPARELSSIRVRSTHIDGAPVYTV